MRLQFQRTQLKGMLLPALVTIVSAATVLAYGFWWIPKQQRELNERNFRILIAQSALVKAKVDNFDTLIDNAIEALGGEAKTDPKRLGMFIQSFAPDLEVQDADEPAWGARRARELADDPPIAIIGRDEGTNYLYLGYGLRNAAGHVTLKIVARTNLEALASKFLSTGSDFDALLLVTRAGQVIVEQAPSGLQLARLDSTALRIAPEQAATPPEKFEVLAGSRSLVDVTLGDTDYKLYVQPMQLSLQGAPVDRPAATDASDPKQTATATAGAHHTGRQAEEWALCGLLRADRFQKASSNVSSTSVVRFGIGFAVLVLTLPLIKFHIISSRERLRASDMVQLAMATFGLTALAVWALAHTCYFSIVYRPEARQQLEQAADALGAHLVTEMERIRAQMDRFQLRPSDHWTSVDGRGRIPVRPGEGSPQFRVEPRDTEVPIRAAAAWPSAPARLSTPDLGPGGLAALPYPYFRLMIWDDLDGWQRVKWSTANGVTPFVSVDTLKFGDYTPVRLARRNGATVVMPDRKGLVGVNQSPNTGDVVTAFWKSLPISGERPVPGRTELAGQMLTVTTPISVSRPVMPDNVQFAVIRADGQVVFHSDPGRSVRENFFEECDNSPELRAAVKDGHGQHVDASYVGRPHLLYVTPLHMPEPWDGQAWSVVTFQSDQVQHTLDREVLTISGGLFVAYALVLGLIWGLAPLAWPDYPVHWFWPDPSRSVAYRAIALVNGAVFAMWAVWLGLRSPSPPALLAVTLALAFSAPLVAASIIAMRRNDARIHRGWRTEYAVARASLLLMLAVLPMAVFVRVAYTFEMKLFTLRTRADVESQIAARTVRVTNDVERFALCVPGPQVPPPARGQTEPCHTNEFLTTRLARDWDVYSVENLAPICRTTDPAPVDPKTALPSALPSCPVATAGDVGADSLATTALDEFLATWHTAHNDYAQQLRTAYLATARRPSRGAAAARFTALPPKFKVDASLPTVIGADPGRWYWLGIGLVLLGACLVMRYVSQRMFVLDIEEDPFDAGMPRSGASVLLIGPPGAGKTARLGDVCALILDLRAMTVVDKRATRAVGAMASQARPTVQHLDGVKGLAAWIDRFDASRLPSETAVGINHLEFGVDNTACRGQALRLIEMLVFRYGHTVWIASTRDPLHALSSMAGAAEPASAEGRNQWSRVLQSFRRWDLGLVPDDGYRTTLETLAPGASPSVLGLVAAECSRSQQLRQAGTEIMRRPLASTRTRSEVLASIGVAAESYYWSVWSARTVDEQVVLRQLADEGVVNPKNLAVLAQLRRHGLILHHGSFRIMNETFRRFVLRAVSPDVVRAWERDGVQMTWANFRTGLSAAAITLVILAILTEYQLVTTWIGYAPALAPVVPMIMRLFAKGADLAGANSGANA